MSRTQRRHRIHERLRRGPVASQEELAAELAAAGENVTQATISRDLRSMGVVKGPDGYRLPDAAGNGNGHGSTPNGHLLSRVLREQVLEIRQADSIVVLGTPAGYANAVGTVLDDDPPKGMVGSVAGDDTIFVACTSRTAANDLAARLRRMRETTNR